MTSFDSMASGPCCSGYCCSYLSALLAFPFDSISVRHVLMCSFDTSVYPAFHISAMAHNSTLGVVRRRPRSIGVSPSLYRLATY